MITYRESLQGKGFRNLALTKILYKPFHFITKLPAE